jgi:hypothetical protein
MAAFQEGYAFEASVTGDVLAVPLITERSAPRWLKLEERRSIRISRALRTTAHMKLAKLQAVSFDYNDRHRWFDLRDSRGQALRLLFAVASPTEPERVVLAALRQHVTASGLGVDDETKAALGGIWPAN